MIHDAQTDWEEPVQSLESWQHDGGEQPLDSGSPSHRQGLMCWAMRVIAPRFPFFTENHIGRRASKRARDIVAASHLLSNHVLLASVHLAMWKRN